MKKNDNIFEKLLAKKHENLRMLVQYRFKDLEEMKKTYYEVFEDTRSVIVYEKFRQVDEAIRIKKENDKQAWYYTI